MAGYRAVSGGYFQTLGIPLEAGAAARRARSSGRAARDRHQRDDGAHALRRRRALGQRIQLGTEPDPDPQFPYMEVVGVVGDVRQQPDAEAKSEMYVPYAQYPDAFLRRMYSNVRWWCGRRAIRRRWPARCARSSARSIRISRSPTCGRWTSDGVRRCRSRASGRCCWILRADRADARGDRRLRSAGARRRAAGERVRRPDGAGRIAADGAGTGAAAGADAGPGGVGARTSGGSGRGPRAQLGAVRNHAVGPGGLDTCRRPRCWRSRCSPAGCRRGAALRVDPSLRCGR